MSANNFHSFGVLWLLVLLWASIDAAVVDNARSALDPYNYTAVWKSLDTHPLPKWYDEAKIGIMMHWGLYSIPNCGSEWFWSQWRGGNCKSYMADNFKPKFTYPMFAKKFTTENFDADEWMEIIKASGAKMEFSGCWIETRFNWRISDCSPKDQFNVRLYHSMMEWFHPLYMKDKKNGYKTQEFVDKKCMPELKELVTKYKPEYIWSDGEWETESSYWKSTEFLAWLYNSSPVRDTVIVNDRWGKETRQMHGDVHCGPDNWVPSDLQKHKFENSMPIDYGSWGYRENAAPGDLKGTQQIIDQMVKSICFNGNFLLNIGPSNDGRIRPIFEERLRNMGSWLKVNGEAIYSSRPWIHPKDNKTKDVWYTQGKSGLVYAIVLRYPESNIIDLHNIKDYVTEKTKVSMLGYDGEIKMIPTATDVVTLEFPPVYKSFQISHWAWTFKFTGLKN